MLRFVGQRVLLAIFPFYLLCPLMNMENLIGFGIMDMSVLTKRLAAVCKSDTIRCSPLQYTEFQQKPRCPTRAPHRELHFYTLRQILFSTGVPVFSPYQVNKQCVSGFMVLGFYPMPKMLINVWNNFPPVCSIKCCSTEIISSQRPWHADKFITETLPVCPFESFFRFVERFGNLQKLSISI